MSRINTIIYPIPKSYELIQCWQLGSEATVLLSVTISVEESSRDLDSKNALELHNLFFQLRKDLDQTFVIVTHDDELAKMADRRIELKDGTIVK